MKTGFVIELRAIIRLNSIKKRSVQIKMGVIAGIASYNFQEAEKITAAATGNDKGTKSRQTRA